MNVADRTDIIRAHPSQPGSVTCRHGRNRDSFHSNSYKQQPQQYSNAKTVFPLSGGVEFILQKSVLCCEAAWVTNECWCAPKLHGSRARRVIHSRIEGTCRGQSWHIQSLIRMVTHRAHRWFTIYSTVKLLKRGRFGTF